MRPGQSTESSGQVGIVLVLDRGWWTLSLSCLHFSRSLTLKSKERDLVQAESNHLLGERLQWLVSEMPDESPSSLVEIINLGIPKSSDCVS